MPFAECVVLTNPYDTGQTWRASKQEKGFIVRQFQDRAAVLHCDEYVWHIVPWSYICYRVLTSTLTSSGRSKALRVLVA